MINVLQSITCKLTTVICCCLVLFFTSCEKAVKVNEDGIISEYNVVVQSSAGEVVEGLGANGIPAFFNFGQMNLESDKMDFVVIGPRMDKGKKIPVNILGALEFKMDTIKKIWYVSERITQNSSGEDLNKEARFLSYQSSIEAWIRMQCDQRNCTNFNWKLPMYLFRAPKEKELQ